MAVRQRTLDELKAMRADLDERIGYHERQLILAWAAAWEDLLERWQLAVDDLLVNQPEGTWPSRSKIRRAKRVREALEATKKRLDGLLDEHHIRVQTDIPKLTKAAAEWEARITASQLPDTEPLTVTTIARFDRVDAGQLEAIVKRTTEDIVSLSMPISAIAEREMRAALVRGVALGTNPRTVARDMLRNLKGGFDGGLNRALVITRTEMLDAQRAAARRQDIANAKTVIGWQWLAQLDRRTCPSCWSQHGSIHPPDAPGPEDHQQGRCTRCPKLVSWAELGYDIPEPPDLLPNAEETFRRLPRADQLAIMGSKRLALLDSGEISFTDLSSRRTTTGWRDSYAPTPLGDLLRVAGRVA